MHRGLMIVDSSARAQQDSLLPTLATDLTMCGQLFIDLAARFSASFWLFHGVGFPRDKDWVQQSCLCLLFRVNKSGWRRERMQVVLSNSTQAVNREKRQVFDVDGKQIFFALAGSHEGSWKCPVLSLHSSGDWVPNKAILGSVDCLPCFV